MQKIQKVSLWFKLLFQLSFIVLPLLLILFWINAPAPLPLGIPGFSFIPVGIHGEDMIYPLARILSPETKFFGFLISLIPYGIVECVLYYLIRLFGLYRNGEIFSLNVVTLWKKIGCTLLIGQLLNPFYLGLMSGTLTWGNGHGHRYIAISFTSVNIGIILMALLIILISWIMAEGYRLREEQQLTV